MGRRKISIAPIADDRNRSVTFLKRKNGLFKKAYELGILCSAEVAVVVFSSAGKLFEFSSADMDPILLRYSHYSGPAHEKRGPSDYATKDIPDLAKRGLGGKMTTLSDEDDALEPEDADGSGGDESMDETPAPAAVPAKKGARKAAGSSAKKRPGSNGTKSERSSSVASQRQPNEEPPHQGFNFQETLEQRAPMHQLPPLNHMPPPFANPYQAQQQPTFNPYLAQLPPGFPSGMGMPPSWAYTGAPAPAPSTSAGPSGSIPGWNNFPGIGMSPMQQHQFNQQMQQQQAHQAQQQANAANPFYPPAPNHFGGPPDFGTQQLQAALQQSQHQHLLPPQSTNQHRFFSSGGPVPSAVAPYSPSQPSVLPLQPPRRQGTDSSVDSGVGGERSASRASGVSRSNSGAQKPRLSVNIPSEEDRRAKTGASILVPPNGDGGGGSNPVFTDEPEGLDDEGDPNTGLPSSGGSRFAADLLPSPAGFLNDVLYSAGPFSLQTAMPIPNRTNDSSVFEWPKASDGVFEGAAAIRRLKRGSDDLPSPVTREMDDRMGEDGRESSADEGSVKKSRLKRG